MKNMHLQKKKNIYFQRGHLNIDENPSLLCTHFSRYTSLSTRGVSEFNLTTDIWELGTISDMTMTMTRIIVWGYAKSPFLFGNFYKNYSQPFLMNRMRPCFEKKKKNSSFFLVSCKTRILFPPAGAAPPGGGGAAAGARRRAYFGTYLKPLYLERVNTKI